MKSSCQILANTEKHWITCENKKHDSQPKGWQNVVLKNNRKEEESKRNASQWLKDAPLRRRAAAGWYWNPGALGQAGTVEAVRTQWECNQPLNSNAVIWMNGATWKVQMRLDRQRCALTKTAMSCGICVASFTVLLILDAHTCTLTFLTATLQPQADFIKLCSSTSAQASIAIVVNTYCADVANTLEVLIQLYLTEQ